MKHRHYHKDVSHLKSIDIYRLLELFEVTCPVAQHIVKKALAAGKRGAKDQAKDMSDIADSANRWIEMRQEDAAADMSFTGVDMGKPGGDKTCLVTVHRGSDGKTIVEDVRFDEARMDAIGQNGNDGEHYSETHITRCCHSRGCAACEPAPKGIQK